MTFPTGKVVTFVRQISEMVAEEFTHLYGELGTWLKQEHKANGTHGDITVDSVSDKGAAASWGEWTDVYTSATFSAGDFTQSGGTAWTVSFSDLTNLSWTRINDMLTVTWYLETTSVTGTPTLLRFPIPDGQVSAKAQLTTFRFNDNGTYGVGVAFCAEDGTTIDLYKTDFTTTWAAAANTTGVNGQFVIRVKP